LVILIELILFSINYFLYRFQIFNDVIQHLPHDDKAKEEMLTVCRHYYRNNPRLLEDINTFDQTYHIDECIRWYTRETFVYKLINKALRTEDIEQLYIFRYYIADLSKQLAQECKKIKTGEDEKIYLYRGTTIVKEEIEKFKGNLDKLIAINGYWSTSRDRSYALTFATKLTHRPDTMAVLFEIECDIHDQNDSIIFADISHLSQFSNEMEVLFDAGSVFQIEKIREEMENDTELYIVQMRTTGKGRDLARKYVEENRRKMEGESPRIMLSILLKRMGKSEKSLQYLEYLLTNPDDENIAHIHDRIGVQCRDENKYDLALEYFDKAFDLITKSDVPEKKYLAIVLHNKGLVYAKQKMFREALSLYRRALKIVKREIGD
jgi:tetratricopeptide (TPR) repeat protein